MDTHQLPNDGKHKLLVTVLDVLSTDTNQLDLEGFAGIEGNSAVDSLFEVIVGVLFDSVPLDNLVVDLVDDLKEDLTITNILEQVVDVDTFDFERVDPETELTLLAGTLNIVINDSSLLEFILLLLGELFKTVTGVKDLGNVDGVDTGVTLVPIISGDEIGNVDGFGVVKHILSTLLHVLVVYVGKGASLLVELVKHVVNSERVLEILAKVSDLTLLTSLSQVVVNPSNQEFFSGKLHEFTEFLTILEEAVDLRSFRDGYLLDGNKAGHLPANTKEHVGLLLKEDGGVDTDKLYSTSGGSDAQLDILTGLENVAGSVLALVHGSHIDSVLVDGAEQANEDHTVSHNVPKVVALGVDREALTDELVVVENVVEESSDGVLLFKFVGVLGALNKTRG